jgi:hypothetical protein
MRLTFLPVMLMVLSCGARAEPYNLGDFRVVLIDDPIRVTFQKGSEPLTRERVQKAIKASGSSQGWRVTGESDAAVELTNFVRDKHLMVLEFSYDENGYTARYQRSANLLYKAVLPNGSPARSIHKNYNIWVGQLVNMINAGLGVPTETQIGFAPLASERGVPYLRYKGRDGYKYFLGQSLPRAFAIAPNGAWGHGLDHRSSAKTDQAQIALNNCNRFGNGQCALYAIDSHVVWTNASVPLELRALEGDALSQHVARFGSVQFNSAATNPFTLSIASDGKAERLCQTCKLPSVHGTVSVKADQGLVCFQWEGEAGYPDSGCFQVLPRGSDSFEMHGTEGARPIRYSLAK